MDGDIMERFINDELQLYRGNDYIINDKITIRQPTLCEICDYGEEKYFSMIYTFTAVGADMKFQLFDIGIDYTQVSDFELFYSFLSKDFTTDKTRILFGDLDFTKFELYKKNDESVILYNAIQSIEIDEYTYLLISDAIRRIHALKKNEQLPANASTKQILIDDARDEYNMKKNSESHSQLKDMISTMINSEGFKYNHQTVWGMKINAFMDSVKRISKIKNADLLLQSGYSGFGISLKDVNNKQLDWLGELE